MPALADHNLLFGILALQKHIITRPELIAAMQAWVHDKARSLGEILQDQQVISADHREFVDYLVQRHLGQNDNDPEKSITAIGGVDIIHEDLLRIGDTDIQGSLARMTGQAKMADPYATLQPAAKATTTKTEINLTPLGEPEQYAIRFRIVRPHAKGGLGEVFVARDQELHREVALKEILERHADDPESRSRFMLEAEITGGLEHPGIVPVYGLGCYADGRPYYAMRFIRGDSLKDALERFHKYSDGAMNSGARGIELRGLLRRFIDVCNAIAYAHSRGILHRDLKPSNVMLGKFGETLVVDWGLAKPIGSPSTPSSHTAEPGEGSLIPFSISGSSATIAGTALGTPQYMSPEQAAGRLEDLGPASDVYSLGATLFCVLTGEPPINDYDVMEVLRKVRAGDIPKLRWIKHDVPPALEAICLKAMSLKPGDRYATALDLAKDVEQWLADEPVSAWPEPWTVKARRWIGRHRTLVTGIAAAVGVALVSLTAATILLTAANERERKAREYAEEQEREAVKQKTIAEKNFQLARSAVDRYHTEVSENVILNEPGMGPLRKKLLEAAREFYDKFVQEHGNDPTLRGELGKATYRLAQITGDIDSQPKAIALHRQAVEQFAAMPAGQVNADTQADLAGCWTQLGRLYRLTDHPTKAEDACGKAIDLWKELAKEYPAEARYQAGLARAQLYLGNVYQIKRQLDDATGVYEKAIAARDALAKAHPTVAEYQRDLAVSHNNLALILRSRGKSQEAEKELRLALALQKPLAEESPHISQYQDDLARTHSNLGDILFARSGPFSGAGAEYEAAHKLRTKLVERHPSFLAYQTLLAETCGQLSTVYSAREEFAKAEDACKEGLAIQRKLAAEHKDVPARQDDLARGLFALAEVYHAAGKGSQAVATFQEAIRLQNKLAADYPKALHYRVALARSQHGLGMAYGKDMEYDLSADAFRKAASNWQKLALQTPGEFANENGLAASALMLAKLGRISEAAAAIDPVATKTRNGDFLYRLACIYSNCVAGATEKAQADRYAVQAMKMLSGARDAGYFESAKNCEKLTSDSELQGIGGLPEFAAWVKSVKGK
ncbi:MAG TPA: protein kinase [Gemmataceae bacterium]|nr:protein kinase [Gemmataceae bacterium]